MRIVSINTNGLRSAARKGFFEWLADSGADVVCVQETKAQEHQLAGPEFLPPGYKAWFRDASTKKTLPPLYGALLKNEADVHLFERIAFMARRGN